MGGQPNEQQVHYPVQNIPHQQNVYFQPPAPQYIPPVTNYNLVHAEAPVLQGSSSSMYPQVPSAHVYPQVQLPQPAYPQIPMQAPVEQPIEARASRFNCRDKMQKLRTFVAGLDVYRVSVFLTVFSAVTYFLFTPKSWPWFLLVAAISAGISGTRFIKSTQDMNEQRPRFYIHALWYSVLNLFLVLVNLWAGRYPWSVFSLSIGGAFVAFHALKTYNTNSNKKFLYAHFIIFIAVITMMLVAGSRRALINMIVMAVWSIVLAVHAKRVQRREERDNAPQPAELEVVQDVSAPVAPQVNESENAQLVQNQQEVFNSIQQAQQEQRAQQAQIHLFQQQPVLYHPGNGQNN
jgi:hypothetical protein